MCAGLGSLLEPQLLGAEIKVTSPATFPIDVLWKVAPLGLRKALRVWLSRGGGHRASSGSDKTV